MFGAKHSKNQIGAWGETIAAQYLSKCGYKIVARNYREKFDEIDIISKSTDGIMVFVEVKTFLKRSLQDNRNNVKKSGLAPENNFTRLKFRKTKRICKMFVAKHPKLISSKLGWRIDLLAIVIGERDEILIKHFKNVDAWE